MVNTTFSEELLTAGVIDSSGNPIAAKLVGDAEAQVTGRSGPFKGWSVIAHRPVRSENATTRALATYKTEIVSPFDVVAIALMFDGDNKINPSGGMGLPNTVKIKSVLEVKNALLSATGSALNTTDLDIPYPFSFQGREEGVLARNDLLATDFNWVSIKGGTRNFARTKMENQYPVPAAPAAVASAGSGLTSGQSYAVGFTRVYPDGMETPGSTATVVAVSGGNLQITMTSPAADGASIGYRPVISLAGQTTPLYETQLGIKPYGVDSIFTQAPSTSTGTSTLKNKRVLNGQAAVLPTGYSSMGSTAAGGANNGEYVAVGIDQTASGYFSTGALSTTGGGPSVILGLDPNKVHASLTIIGDSTSSRGVADEGFMNTGSAGYLVRACMGQTTGYAYNPTIAPLIGHLECGTGGETGATYLISGTTRQRKASLTTSVICTYGTNDLNNLYCSQVIPTTLAIARLSTDQGQYFAQTTLLPKNISSDGFRTLANQSLPAAGLTMAVEGGRRQFNSWLTAGPSAPVTGEAMFGEYATATPATNLYGGGNGVATKFQTRLPFRTGTEVIKVAGAAQVVTTNYTYLGSQVINGQTYASGVQLTGAPVNAASVTADYTPIDGFKTLAGPLADVSTIPSSQEVNAAGVVTMNGGFWKPATETALVTGTSSGSNTTTVFNDTSKAWAQDQWRGYSIRILTDTTTPSSVGQISTITGNTPTALNLGGGTIAVVPSAAATYEIYNPYTGDGVHAKARSQIEMALQFNPAAVK